jgi:hypothetical protein
MNMPGRTFAASASTKYRYSINGQEKDDELNENITTAMYWEYDSRTGRRWNLDPKGNVWESPYLCFGGNPIAMVDINGDIYIPSNGGQNNTTPENGQGNGGSSTRDRANVIGIKAHSALSLALSLRNLIEPSFAVPVRWVTNSSLPSGKRPDVVDELNKRVWELKPITWKEYNAYKNGKAISQILDYVAELNVTRGGGYSAGGNAYETPMVSPQLSADGRYIFTYFVPNPQSGIIYYVTTPTTQPIPVPKTQLKPKPKPIPDPVVTPVSKYTPWGVPRPVLVPVKPIAPNDGVGSPIITPSTVVTTVAILYGIWWAAKIIAAPSTGGASLLMGF